MFAINNVSLKYISKIIKEFEDFTYEGYVRKRSKHMPTGIYFYIERNFSKCTIRFNMRVGPVRKQMNKTQKKIFLIRMSVLQTKANQKG